MKRRTVALILVADLGLLVLLEVSLHLFGLFRPQPLFTEFQDPQGRTQVRFEVASTKPFFAARKSPGAVRIFCYGGSTAFGFPFHKKTSFPAELEWLLRQARPELHWEVVNLGMIGLDSEETRDIFRASLAYAPDLAIVYGDQNEYFPSSRLNELDFPRLLAVREFFERHCRLYQALTRIGPFLAGIPRFRLQPHPELFEALSGQPDTGPQEPKPIPPRVLKLRQDLFRLHLEQMLDAAKTARATVILSTLVVNLRDWPPEPLPYPAGVEIIPLSGAIAAAKDSLAAKDGPAAEQELHVAQGLARNYALTDFLLGRALELEGRTDQARERYLLARQEDVNQHRAPAEINAIIREVAPAKGAVLFDAEQLFAQSTSYPAVGFDLVIDHVHPNLAGQALLATALLHAIQHNPAFASPAWQPVPALTEPDIIRDFSLDPDYLADVYLRLGLYYGIQKNLPDKNAWTLQTFDRVSSLHPNDPLPRLCQTLIYLSQADDPSALAVLNSLMREQPAATALAVSRYLSRSASLRQNALLLHLPADPLRPPLRGLLLTLPEAKEGKPAAWKPLQSYNRFFAWRAAEQKWLEISAAVATALQSQKEKLAGRTRPLHPIYLYAPRRPQFIHAGPGLSPSRDAAETSFWIESPQGQLLSEGLTLAAELVQSLTLDYRLELQDPRPPVLASLYWATAAAPGFSEDRKFEFEVIADGRFHRLSVPLGQLPTWLISGTVTRLRLDPAPAPGKLSLRELSLQPLQQ